MLFECSGYEPVGYVFGNGWKVDIVSFKMEDCGMDFGLESNEEDDVTKEIYHVTALVGQRKSETDFDFNRYEGEDMVELDDDDHGSVDPSVRLNVASTIEMDLIRDSIRDQIVEHMKLN
ncbi:hypothetical protein V6N12_045796 [Hibiscus sabdariffa]|uniref:Uncharacterized protein n=1 Tax=Hibiscus sabdariffa TaxID=183260 RepID=A0ABR2G3T8_9ROSI